LGGKKGNTILGLSAFPFAQKLDSVGRLKPGDDTARPLSQCEHCSGRALCFRASQKLEDDAYSFWAGPGIVQIRAVLVSELVRKSFVAKEPVRTSGTTKRIKSSEISVSLPSSQQKANPHSLKAFSANKKAPAVREAHHRGHVPPRTH